MASVLRHSLGQRHHRIHPQVGWSPLFPFKSQTRLIACNPASVLAVVFALNAGGGANLAHEAP